MKSSLSGIRILDLSRLLPGPFCTLLLADMGAEVLKIEQPEGGDYARYYPPFAGEYSAFFAALNRNKESMTLNLKEPRGVEILSNLINTYDVVVESFRPGVMARLGVSYEDLKAIKPDIIYCSISGYGADGPDSERAGHDLNFIARAALLEQNGERAQKPVVPGFQVADIAGGALYAALGIVSALFARERTGQGAFIDISMTEGALSFLLPTFANLSCGGTSQRGAEMLSGGVPSYQVYETKDGRFLAIGALEPKFWHGVAHALELEELASSGLLTGKEGLATTQVVADKIRQKNLREWLAIFEPVDVCVEPVRTPLEVLNDELFKAREVFFQLGGVCHTRTPLTDRDVDHRPAPRLGEQTSQIMKMLGYDELSIAKFREDGVI